MTDNMWDGLQDYCTMPEKELLKMFENQGYEITFLPDGSYHAFKDNNSNVLAVAHLDIHSAIKHKQDNYTFYDEYNTVFSPALDDRLGVYIITKLLPLFGVVPDVLLTTNEEIGASTAMYFTSKLDYNWIFSFDRSGDDVVMYEYQTSALSVLLGHMGFTVGWGTFSDICWLDHLGVAGFNFGTGYIGEHTEGCYASLDITAFMVTLFIDFYNELNDVKFEYVPGDNPYSSWISDPQGWHDWEESEYDYLDDGWGRAMENDDEFDEFHGLMGYTEIGSKQDAIIFDELHESLGHEVDYYIVNDISASVICFDCDCELVFKDI